MKINIAKIKDEYAKSCGSEDWYDHINGMSAREIELEMEYVCEYLASPMLEMLVDLRECRETWSDLFQSDKDRIELLISKSTEL